MYVIYAVSAEYVRVSVAASVNGTDIDPTGDAVQLAFTLQGALPGAGDWKTASWETDPTQLPPIHYARALVGPSGVVQLAPGLYDVFLKVIDNPELPVKKSGPLRCV